MPAPASSYCTPFRSGRGRRWTLQDYLDAPPEARRRVADAFVRHVATADAGGLGLSPDRFRAGPAALGAPGTADPELVAHLTRVAEARAATRAHA